MAKKKIYIVDDEQDIRNLLHIGLEKEGFLTTEFETGLQFISYIQSQRCSPDDIDVIILDIMLPHTNGLDICKALKTETEYKKFAHIPIILLSAKETETDKVLGLELGADDYITKPFSIKELSARIKVVLRRNPVASNTHSQFSVGANNNVALEYRNIKINKNTLEVSVDGIVLDFTSTEFNILSKLLENPRWVVSRTDILSHLWGTSKLVSERTIDVHVKHIRDKLGEAGTLIKNIRGMGYKIE